MYVNACFNLAGMFGATGQPAQSSLFGSTLGQPATSGFGDNKSMFGSTPTSTAGLGNVYNIFPQAIYK
jgi:hypothetical protein